jgi:hypothetical protein
MQPYLLKPRVRNDIAARVEKVLRELGYPAPPLRLEEVRALLDLDLGYFSSEADGLLKRMVSRLTRSGKQVLARPQLLAEAILKFDLRALYLPDEKKVLIDEKAPLAKHRWLEAHEMGHRMLDWHQDMMLGDDDSTVSPNAHAKMEAEANFAAGALIFLGSRFEEECRSSVPSIALAQKLGKAYGNSLTSTLWRMVEYARDDLPVIAAVGRHPKITSCTFKHLVASPCFDSRFCFPPPADLVAAMRSYYNWRNKGPLGSGEVELLDRHGARHVFSLETFFNGYDALTLGVWKSRKSVVIVR